MYPALHTAWKLRKFTLSWFFNKNSVKSICHKWRTLNWFHEIFLRSRVIFLFFPHCSAHFYYSYSCFVNFWKISHLTKRGKGTNFLNKGPFMWKTAMLEFPRQHAFPYFSELFVSWMMSFVKKQAGLLSFTLGEMNKPLSIS